MTHNVDFLEHAETVETNQEGRTGVQMEQGKLLIFRALLIALISVYCHLQIAEMC